MISEDRFSPAACDYVRRLTCQERGVFLIGPQEYTLHAVPKCGKRVGRLPHMWRVWKFGAIPHIAGGFVQTQQMNASVEIDSRSIFVKARSHNHVAWAIVLLQRERKFLGGKNRRERHKRGMHREQHNYHHGGQSQIAFVRRSASS